MQDWSLYIQSKYNDALNTPGLAFDIAMRKALWGGYVAYMASGMISSSRKLTRVAIHAVLLEKPDQIAMYDKILARQDGRRLYADAFRFTVSGDVDLAQKCVAALPGTPLDHLLRSSGAVARIFSGQYSTAVSLKKIKVSMRKTLGVPLDPRRDSPLLEKTPFGKRLLG